MDRETALKTAANFGGGMWEGEVCGAVVGALMAIGLKYGQGDTCDPDQKNAMLGKAAASAKKSWDIRYLKTWTKSWKKTNSGQSAAMS